MPRKKIYSEPKRKVNLSLTETATKWLEEKRVQLTASSLSDVIERLAFLVTQQFHQWVTLSKNHVTALNPNSSANFF
ncbi:MULTISPECIES: hypothetical protein [unclassified Microcoleus]|uniref:hypothetical protein n=1 Tax=unclassified Microcoleus TaxID=2642155 RepID=UPI002FD00066